MSAGELFSVMPDRSACPLIRHHGGEDEILFLIHPKSEGLYRDLLTHYWDSVITLSGFESGMLYRETPWFLNPSRPNDDGVYALPILALYGRRNIDVLKKLVRVNGGNVTAFLKHCFLGPFAEIFFALLSRHEISIEGHGQNLLFMLDSTEQIKGLIYRDMGGGIFVFQRMIVVCRPICENLTCLFLKTR